MAQSIQSAHRHEATVFGYPVSGFGLFSSLLLSFASAMFTLCATTMVAIFGLLIYRVAGHPAVDMAIAYRWFGFPASILVLAVALPFFLTLWIKAKLRGPGIGVHGSEDRD